MSDPMKDKLTELIRNAPKLEFPSGRRSHSKTYQTSANLADYLIENGVVIIDPQKYPPVTGQGIIDTIMGVPLDEMAALIKERENGKSKQSEWISVSERLPESGAHCLLCCELRCIDGTRRPYVCDGFHVERFNIKASGVDDDVVTEYNTFT